MNAPAIGDISVLTIDDQRTMRAIVRQLLRQVGITRVSEAENGRDAIERLMSGELEVPDAIICDLHMDAMDGMAFTAAVRRGKTKLSVDTPIVLLTGEDDDFVLDVAGQAGATLVLHKPCKAGELYHAISQAVGYQLSSA